MTTKCPYDPQHIMPSSSLHTHLAKCKSPNKINFGICRYNQLHIILKDDLS